MKNEPKYRRLIENLSEVVYEIDDCGIIQYIGPSIEKLIGYFPSEIKNRRITDFIGGDDRFLMDRMLKLKEKGELVSEYNIRSKSGKVHWIRFSTKADFRDGVFTGGTGILLDITEGKEAVLALQKSEELYRSILQASPDIIVLTDLEKGRFLMVSPRAFSFFRIGENEDFRKFTLIDFLDEADHALAVLFMTRSQEESMGTVEFKARRADGSLFDIEINSDLIRDKDGQPVSRLIIIRDITDRKKAEDAMRQNESALKEMNAAKDKLFSIIAHDLRGPIASFVQGLEMIITRENMDEVAKNIILSGLYKSSKTTFNLLENLLVWSRLQIGSVKIHPQPFILNNAIEESIDMITPQAKQKDIKISVKEMKAHRVFADKDSINLIVRNLLSNAVKFTPRQGTVTVIISEQEGFIETVIADTGAGMGKEVLAGLFRSSYLSTYGTNGEKGSGIGLLLVKDFVEKNGGIIRAESEPGAGSRFSFTLPKAEFS